MLETRVLNLKMSSGKVYVTDSAGFILVVVIPFPPAQAGYAATENSSSECSLLLAGCGARPEAEQKLSPPRTRSTQRMEAGLND